MEVEDFSFCVDDSGTEYITFKEILQRRGREDLTQNIEVLPKMFVTGGQRCPVELLKQYLSGVSKSYEKKVLFTLKRT